MSRRSNYLDGMDNFREQNLRFVRNELEDNFNQYFGGTETPGNLPQKPPPRDAVIAQPTPVNKHIKVDQRRRFFRLVGVSRKQAHVLALRTLKIPDFELGDYQRLRVNLVAEMGDSRLFDVDAIVLGKIHQLVESHESSSPRAVLPSSNIDWNDDSRPRNRHNERRRSRSPVNLRREDRPEREVIRGKLDNKFGRPVYDQRSHVHNQRRQVDDLRSNFVRPEDDHRSSQKIDFLENSRRQFEDHSDGSTRRQVEQAMMVNPRRQFEDRQDNLENNPRRQFIDEYLANPGHHSDNHIRRDNQQHRGSNPSFSDRNRDIRNCERDFSDRNSDNRSMGQDARNHNSNFRDNRPNFNNDEDRRRRNDETNVPDQDNFRNTRFNDRNEPVHRSHDLNTNFRGHRNEIESVGSNQQSRQHDLDRFDGPRDLQHPTAFRGSIQHQDNVVNEPPSNLNRNVSCKRESRANQESKNFQSCRPNQIGQKRGAEPSDSSAPVKLCKRQRNTINKRRRIAEEHGFRIAGFIFPYINNNRITLPQPERESYAIKFFEQKPFYGPIDQNVDAAAAANYKDDDGVIFNNNFIDIEGIKKRCTDMPSSSTITKTRKDVCRYLKEKYEKRNYRDWFSWWKEYKYFGAVINKHLNTKINLKDRFTPQECKYFGAVINKHLNTQINLKDRFTPQECSTKTEPLVEAVFELANCAFTINVKPYQYLLAIFMLMNESFLEKLAENMSRDLIEKLQDMIRAIPNDEWLFRMRGMIYMWRRYYARLKHATPSTEWGLLDLLALGDNWKNPRFHWVAKQAFDELKAISERDWREHRKLYPGLRG